MADNADRDSQAADCEHGVVLEDEPTHPSQLLLIGPRYQLQGWNGLDLSNKVVSVYTPPEQVLRRIQGALESHAKLQRSTEALENSIKEGKLDASQVESAAASNHAALSDIKSLLDACIDSFPTIMRSTPTSHVKAQKVFATAELLEEILLYLTPRELLDAVRVNHATLQIFKDSPKLLDMLHMRPHKDGFLGTSLASNFPGIYIELDSNRAERSMRLMGYKTSFNTVSVLIQFDRRSIFTIGSRCRSTLPLQLPITSMRATVSCCKDFNHPTQYADWGESTYHRDLLNLAAPPWPTPHPVQTGEGTDEEDEVQDEEEDAQDEDQGKGCEIRNTQRAEDVFNANVVETLVIRCATGLTIGHIADAAERICKAHLHCPHASFEEHAANGTVKPDIVFGAILTLKKDDPYLVQKDKAEISERLYHLDEGDNDGKV